MKQPPQDHFYALQIKTLMMFSPEKLFQKLSELDWYKNTLRQWINQHLDNPRKHAPVKHVVDVGCATGYLTKYIFDKGHKVCGIDISKRMISTAQRKNPSINFSVGDASKLPFHNETFDIIASASIINSAANPHQIVEQSYRTCKFGGWATFLFPAAGFTDDDLKKCIATLGLSGFSKAALTMWHTSAPKMSADEVTLLLTKAGFNNCESDTQLGGMVASVSGKKVAQ